MPKLLSVKHPILQFVAFLVLRVKAHFDFDFLYIRGISNLNPIGNLFPTKS